MKNLNPLYSKRNSYIRTLVLDKISSDLRKCVKLEILYIPEEASLDGVLVGKGIYLCVKNGKSFSIQPSGPYENAEEALLAAEFAFVNTLIKMKSECKVSYVKKKLSSIIRKNQNRLNKGPKPQSELNHLPITKMVI